MKTLTIILACLLSSSVMAQTKEVKLLPSIDTRFIPADSSYYLKDWTTGNGAVNTFIGLKKPLTYTWMTEAKKAMEVTEKDSLGNIKVWIDPKRITWTSDSTFVIKTR